ncbi:hypothetical protein L7F22_002132 [Adiantum nelumboides]|nr:hypothetical protein [Adiantum nelumboides]
MAEEAVCKRRKQVDLSSMDAANIIKECLSEDFADARNTWEGQHPETEVVIPVQAVDGSGCAVCVECSDFVFPRCPVWVEIAGFPRTWKHFLPLLAAQLGKVTWSPNLDTNSNRFCVLWDTDKPTPSGITVDFGDPLTPDDNLPTQKKVLTRQYTKTVVTPNYRAPEELIMRCMRNVGYTKPLFCVREEPETPSVGECYAEDGPSPLATQLNVIFDVIGTPCWKDIESVPGANWHLIDQEYTDDTLLFLHYSPDILDTIRYALEVFCVTTGACVNWDKSYGILAGSDDVPTWGPGDFTWLRPGETCRYLGFQKKFQIKWEGPFTVVNKFDNGTYQLADLDGAEHKYRVNGYRLKKYLARLMTVVTEEMLLMEKENDKVIENVNESQKVPPLLLHSCRSTLVQGRLVYFCRWTWSSSEGRLGLVQQFKNMKRPLDTRQLLTEEPVPAINTGALWKVKDPSLVLAHLEVQFEAAERNIDGGRRVLLNLLLDEIEQHRQQDLIKQSFLGSFAAIKCQFLGYWPASSEDREIVKQVNKRPLPKPSMLNFGGKIRRNTEATHQEATPMIVETKIQNTKRGTVVEPDNFPIVNTDGIVTNDLLHLGLITQVDSLIKRPSIYK